ncbi:transposase [Streptomyces sp. NBC_00885]|uniref:transposase n=1 Tax=Streptomyces sp. NBC_00885 TaxID=2975857 RepID=UPI00386761F9
MSATRSTIRLENDVNSRNGTRAKTVPTDVRPVDVKVSRDTTGTFEPQIAASNEMVLSRSAKGPMHGDISAHLAEVYGAEALPRSQKYRRPRSRTDPNGRASRVRW